MQLKQAFTPLQRSDDDIDNNSRLIHFRHPAYPDTEPDLLCLSALDGGDGIDYDLALTSCCIITGNTFATGWLATRVSSGDGDGDGDGPLFHRVGRPGDGILRHRQYHFCIGEQDPTTCKYSLYLRACLWLSSHVRSHSQESPGRECRVLVAYSGHATGHLLG